MRKFFSTTTLIILGLALVVWTFFYIWTPQAPLTFSEMTVVTIVCTVIVLFVKSIWRQRSKGGTSDGKAP